MKHSVHIQDGNGNVHDYTSSNDHSIEANRTVAMKAFNTDVEHGFVAGPGTIVGHSSIDTDVYK